MDRIFEIKTKLESNSKLMSKYSLRIQELKEEIKQIDSEQMRCEKAKKGWLVATVVGGVGVVATGTAAIVQADKLKKQKTDTTKKSETETEDKK